MGGSLRVHLGKGGLRSILVEEGHFLVSTISPKLTSQLSSSLVHLEELDDDPPKLPDFKKPFDPPSNFKIYFIRGVIGFLQ